MQYRQTTITAITLKSPVKRFAVISYCIFQRYETVNPQKTTGNVRFVLDLKLWSNKKFKIFRQLLLNNYFSILVFDG